MYLRRLGVDALDTSGIPHEHLGIALTIENIEKHSHIFNALCTKERTPFLASSTHIHVADLLAKQPNQRTSFTKMSTLSFVDAFPVNDYGISFPMPSNMSLPRP